LALRRRFFFRCFFFAVFLFGAFAGFASTATGAVSATGFLA
jgi:hypothetical protein